MQIQKGGGVSPHTKEKGMPKIYLASKTGQEIPTGREDGKDAGQDQDAQQIRVLGKNRQKEQNKKEKENKNPAGQDEHLPFNNIVKPSQIETKHTHVYLSSSKEMPNRPSGLINSTNIMMDNATEPFRYAPMGAKKTTSASANPRI